MSSSSPPGKAEPSLPLPALISSASPLQRCRALESAWIWGTLSFQGAWEITPQSPVCRASSGHHACCWPGRRSHERGCRVWLSCSP